MVDTTRKGFMSPQAARTFGSTRPSVSPLQMNNPAKRGIRVVESGELRIVNNAAK